MGASFAKWRAVIALGEGGFDFKIGGHVRGLLFAENIFAPPVSLTVRLTPI